MYPSQYRTLRQPTNPRPSPKTNKGIRHLCHAERNNAKRPKECNLIIMISHKDERKRVGHNQSKKGICLMKQMGDIVGSIHSLSETSGVPDQLRVGVET